MKNAIFSLIICVSICYTAQAQSYTDLTASIDPMKVTIDKKPNAESLKADVMSRDAMFPGGMKMLKKFIESNNNYKAVADETFAEGAVNLRFLVNTDGSISNIQVLNSDNQALNEAAVNIVKAMPNWEAAVKDGYYTARRIVMPIYFKLK